MPIAVIWAGTAAFAGAIVAIAVYHFAWVRPALAQTRRLAEAHDALLSGGDAGAADRLAELAAAQASVRTLLDALTGRVQGLEGLAGTDISRIGFVRYNALDDTGSDLSYALALLNREGDGVVLSSIYSRTDTRTFGKAVSRFKPAATASDEELRAIERARGATPTT